MKAWWWWGGVKGGNVEGEDNEMMRGERDGVGAASEGMVVYFGRGAFTRIRALGMVLFYYYHYKWMN